MYFWRNIFHSSHSSSKRTNNNDENKEESTDGERKDQRNCPNISYDTSLPTQHSYLGSNLEELSGRTVLDDYSILSIPLLTLPGVVLIPGQTLPLQLYHPATVSMMTHVIDSDRTFGLINSRVSGRTFGENPIGTTAEIRSYREEGEESFGLTMLRILAEGRQRFRLIETNRQHDGMIVGKVQILPEIILGDPGLGARLRSLDRYRIPAHSDDDKENVDGIQHKARKRPHDKYNFANYTSWPSFVYKQYDPGLLMNKIKTELRGWNSSLLKGEVMPIESRDFSYWVAANLPLDDNQRTHLLSLNNDIQRLRCELRILEQCSVLKCRDCHSHVGDRKDIFSMSLQGPQGTYVNPNGYVHETITLYNTRGLLHSGRPSTEQSWFPGYAWRIAECEQCRSHMGWKFNAVSKKLQPTKFWALCRASLTADLRSEDAEMNHENNGVE